MKSSDILKLLKELASRPAVSNPLELHMGTGVIEIEDLPLAVDSADVDGARIMLAKFDQWRKRGVGHRIAIAEQVKALADALPSGEYDGEMMALWWMILLMSVSAAENAVKENKDDEWEPELSQELRDLLDKHIPPE